MSLSRVRAEWKNRAVAEYRSALFTHELVLWMMRVGYPEELITAGLVIVEDELVHSRMSRDVFEDAGGDERIELPKAMLPSVEGWGVEQNLVSVAVELFCLGETIAVPLFAKMKQAATQSSAQEALERILVDEVRHRDFGWHVLDWALEQAGQHVRDFVQELLPGFYETLKTNYGSDALGSASDEEQGWGVLGGRDYREILAETLMKEYQPRFLARGIHVPTFEL